MHVVNALLCLIYVFQFLPTLSRWTGQTAAVDRLVGIYRLAISGTDYSDYLLVIYFFICIVNTYLHLVL